MTEMAKNRQLSLLLPITAGRPLARPERQAVVDRLTKENKPDVQSRRTLVSELQKSGLLELKKG